MLIVCVRYLCFAYLWLLLITRILNFKLLFEPGSFILIKTLSANSFDRIDQVCLLSVCDLSNIGYLELT